jgi:hypothetical protein
MYGAVISCSHKVFLSQPPDVDGKPLVRGIPLPRLPDARSLRLTATSDLSKCVLTLDVIAGLDAEHIAGRDKEVNRCVQRIVKDAHAYKRRKEVRSFVMRSLWPGDRFALQESDAFWDVHRRGVVMFSAQSLQYSMDATAERFRQEENRAAAYRRARPRRRKGADLRRSDSDDEDSYEEENVRPLHRRGRKTRNERRAAEYRAGEHERAANLRIASADADFYGARAGIPGPGPPPPLRRSPRPRPRINPDPFGGINTPDCTEEGNPVPHRRRKECTDTAFCADGTT